MTAVEQACRDEGVVPAPIGEAFSVLCDLASWSHWWTLVRVVPLGDSTLAPGVRFRFEGERPGGPTSTWTVEVQEVHPPERIELAYVDGDLLGRVAWELEAVDPASTRVAYVYRGVRAAAPNSAATFERYGTRLHSVAMRVDALAGLARYVRGEPLGEAWRAEVAARMTEGVAALA